MADAKTPPFDWTFLFQWMVATSLGWLAAGFLGPGIALAASGLVCGFLQYLILQRRVRRPSHWVSAGAAGWALGALLLLAAVPLGMNFLNGLVLGGLSGAAQWLVLRREVYLAGWWPLICIVAWTTGMALLPGIFLTGIMAGLIQGVALELLLRNPKPEKKQFYGQ
jgi:hypothetical protein